MPLLLLIEERDRAVPLAWEKMMMVELLRHWQFLMDMLKGAMWDLELLVVPLAFPRSRDLAVLRTQLLTRINTRMTSIRALL